jgi:hypothetical protein
LAVPGRENGVDSVTLRVIDDGHGFLDEPNEHVYPSAVTAIVRDYFERGGRGEEQFDVLTPRELEVLKLIAEA